MTDIVGKKVDSDDLLIVSTIFSELCHNIRLLASYEIRKQGHSIKELPCETMKNED